MSHNKVGETMSFQTNISSSSTFDPSTSTISGGRVSWQLGDATGFTATNSLFHIFSGDTGTTKTITLRTNRLSNLKNFGAYSDNIIGQLDMTGWDNLAESVGTGFGVGENPELTSVINTYSPHAFYVYSVENCDITGNLDLSVFPAGITYLYLEDNPHLSGVTFTATTHNVARLFLHDCDLQGNLDVSGFQNFPSYFSTNNNFGLTGITLPTPPNDNNYVTHFIVGPGGLIGELDVDFTKFTGQFITRYNPNLTKINHSFSELSFGNYWANDCDLTGNHDMSMLTGFGGNFDISSNLNLTSISHTASTTIFSAYSIDTCDITGNLNLPFSGLGGSFRCFSNSNLTSITHAPSSQYVGLYHAQLCDLTGNHDMSMLSGLGGSLNIYSNTNLSSITHGISHYFFTSYIVNGNNLTGIHDLSPLKGLAGRVKTYSNPNLSGITFPHITSGNTFSNDGASSTNRAFSLHSCNLGFVDFLPLSGATMDVNSTNGASIGLEDNNMLTSEVNYILANFAGLSNTYNAQGWTGVTLDISGNNVGPDSLSGGYDGIGALMSLTGTPNNWNVTYSSFDTYSFFFDGPPGAEFITTADEGIYDLSTGVTLSVWVKPISGDPTTSGGIIDKFSTTGDDSGYSLWQSSASGGVWRGTFGIDEPVGGPKQAQVEYGVPNTDWQHLCATFDTLTGDLILYHNGVARDTESNEVGSLINLNNEDLIIGARTPSGGNDFGGNIDEISIWNIPFNVAQINEIYNGGPSGQAPGDLGLLPMAQAGNGVGWYRMGDNASWNGSSWLMPNTFNPGTGDATSTDLLFTNRELETP